MTNQMRPIHPGEILREEYLAPLGSSANALAQVLGVPANRISAIVAEKRAVIGAPNDRRVVSKPRGFLGASEETGGNPVGRDLAVESVC